MRSSTEGLICAPQQSGSPLAAFLDVSSLNSAAPQGAALFSAEASREAASAIPAFLVRVGRMRFPGNRVLTPGRAGVISRPPQTGGPASPGQPETPTASTARPEDKGPSLQRFLSYCPRADVLSSCRNAGAYCFGLLRRLYDGQPVQTALIFDNRIGLLEASALYACCRWFRLRGRLVVAAFGSVLLHREW